ncbi:hypothetical protein AVEN_95397-1 [Araneus ventricosus]|uniref:Uncharacterized protein n=1 Tax=Araneus ventricosus TaxID=182803 RepID=A0A4Y2CGG7_ARAVE|nr:hypothetical protein AVEN_95397-1 [Araneus ventricosus]
MLDLEIAFRIRTLLISGASLIRLWCLPSNRNCGTETGSNPSSAFVFDSSPLPPDRNNKKTGNIFPRDESLEQNGTDVKISASTDAVIAFKCSKDSIIRADVD